MLAMMDDHESISKVRTLVHVTVNHFCKNNYLDIYYLLMTMIDGFSMTRSIIMIIVLSQLYHFTTCSSRSGVSFNNEAPLIRPSQLLIVTVIDLTNHVIIRDALTLVRSIRIFGGELNKATIMIGIINEDNCSYIDNQLIYNLYQLQTQIIYLTSSYDYSHHHHHDYNSFPDNYQQHHVNHHQYAKTLNKYKMFTLIDTTKYDYFLWLDADIIIFDDIMSSLYMHKYPGEISCIPDVYNYMIRYPIINKTNDYWNPLLSSYNLLGLKEIASHGICNTGLLYYDNLSLHQFNQNLLLILSNLTFMNIFGNDRFIDSLIFTKIIHKMNIEVTALSYELNYMAFFEDELIDDIKTDIHTIKIAHMLTDTELYCVTLDNGERWKDVNESITVFIRSVSSIKSDYGHRHHHYDYHNNNNITLLTTECGCYYSNSHLPSKLKQSMLREKMEIFRDRMLCLYMAGVILPPMLSDDNHGDSDDNHSDSDDTQHDSDDNSRYHHDDNSHDDNNSINVKNQFSKGHDDKVSNHATTSRDFDDDDDDVYNNIYVAVNIKKKKIRRRDKSFQLLLSQFKINSELVYELYNTTIHDDDGDDDNNNNNDDDDDNYIDIRSDDIGSNYDSSYNNYCNERHDSSRIDDVIVDGTGEESEIIILTKIDKVDNTVKRNSDKKRINVDENRRSRIKRSNSSDDHHDIDDDSIDSDYLSVKSCFIISPAARINDWLLTLSSIRDDMILNFVMRCNIKYNINNNIYSNSNRRDRDSSGSGDSHDGVKDRSNSDIGINHYHNHGDKVISIDTKLLIYNSIIISNSSKDLYNIYNATANILSSSYTMININNFNSIMRKKKIKMRKINNNNDNNNNTLDDDIDNNYYDIEVSYSTSFNIYNHLHHNDLLHHHLLKDIDIEFHSIIITSYSQLSSLLSPANNNHHHHHPSTKLSSSPSASSSLPSSSVIASKYILYFHSKAKIIMEDQLSSGS